MSEPTLTEAMEALAGAQSEGEDHPSPDELWAYHARELSEEARERLQGHLAWCSECTRTVLDLAAGPDVELRDESLERTEEEEKEDWEALRKNLGLEDLSRGDPAPMPQPIPMPLPPPRRPEPLVRLLAAALAVAVVGFSFWVFQLKQHVAELRGPTANVFVVDLESIDAAATRDPEDVRVTAVPPGMETVVFLLVQDDVPAFDDYEVEVLDARGRLTWRHRGLSSPPEGGFSFAAPVDSLPPGTLEIRLFGLRDDRRELVSTYRTRVESTPLD